MVDLMSLLNIILNENYIDKSISNVFDYLISNTFDYLPVIHLIQVDAAVIFSSCILPLA